MAGASADASDQSTRTPTALAIKIVTTHLFALVNYAYVSNLLRRPTRSHIQALRLLFFAFVPTLPLVELLITTSRSLVQYFRNYEADEEIHVRYYIASALGMHASRSQDDDDKDTLASSKNVCLLDVGSTFAEKHLVPFDWVWVGKFCASLFALAQAIGTVIMWARRLKSHDADCFSFDHRNGSMAIASSICSAICIVVLLLRSTWKVSKIFEVSEKKTSEGGYWGGQTSQFIAHALLSMSLHLSIATIASRGNKWLYTSVGSVVFLCGGTFQAWQSLLLLLFIYIFRHEIMRRVGISTERYTRYVGDRRWKRVKTLLGLAVVVWVMVDIIRPFVVDILQVVDARKRNLRWFWFQDPLSDELVVI